MAEKNATALLNAGHVSARRKSLSVLCQNDSLAKNKHLLANPQTVFVSNQKKTSTSCGGAGPSFVLY
ncbi:MAG: hypothetical protein Q4C48_08200 [Lachnospiraceae bacterium]|nr:hypothetical protein [Lachnospiraceae bacterium]